MSAGNTQPSATPRAVASCPKCGGAGLYIRTRHFEGEAADVWECRAPQCTSYGLLWHVSRGFNGEEKSQIRRRVLVAESALLKARNAVADAEVELAVARHLSKNPTMQSFGKRMDDLIAVLEGKTPSELPPPESQGQRERSGLATGSGAASKRRWREYPAEQFSEADLPVWGYYPGRTHNVRLIDFMGNQMTHWMPARDDIPEPPSVRQPSPNVQAEPRRP